MLDVNVNFDKIQLLCPRNPFRRKKPKQKALLEEILKDINNLINNDEFDNQFLSTHLLNKCVQITKSEYGFLGMIKKKPHTDEKYLKTLAITNIAWNLSSFEFFKKFIQHDLCFYNLHQTIFGCSILNQKATIINKYDTQRGVLPKGHPPVKRFLGVPIIKNGTVIAFIGLCNKLYDYSKKKDLNSIKEIMDITGMIFFIIESAKEPLPSQKEAKQEICMRKAASPSP